MNTILHHGYPIIIIIIHYGYGLTYFRIMGQEKDAVDNNHIKGIQKKKDTFLILLSSIYNMLYLWDLDMLFNSSIYRPITYTFFVCIINNR